MTIRPRITPSTPNTLLLNRIDMPPDNLASSKDSALGSFHYFDFVAELLHPFDGFRADTVFQVDGHVEDVAGIGHSGSNADSRRV